MSLLGILSDTHNNLPNLQKALDVFRGEGVTSLIHCGDVTNPETLCLLEGFEVHLTYGNGDYASGEILNVLRELNWRSTAGLTYTGEFDGVRVAATHGHVPDLLEGLISSGHYQFVFRGHSHRHKDELRGSTRVINPGALGGLHPEDRQVCILDLQAGLAKFVVIA
jgi:uncharacterized protein